MATPWILLSALTNSARQAVNRLADTAIFALDTLNAINSCFPCVLPGSHLARSHPWHHASLDAVVISHVIIHAVTNAPGGFVDNLQFVLGASPKPPSSIKLVGQVSEFTGRKGKEVAEQGESAQFGLLVGAAAAYVAASWWLVVTYPVVAVTPLSSTLIGAAITTLVFLTLIGFAVRRTNVIETAGLALYVAYNIWLCSETGDSDGYGEGWIHISSTYTPLVANIMPHLQTLVNFIRHTLPKPLLVSLLYRLLVLHLASRILPLIGGDSWAGEAGVDDGWDERPSSRVTTVLLTYRQTIFVTVYSHLLLLDHTSQVWWRWTNIFFTLAAWSVEILLTGDDDDLGVKWKVD